MNIIEIPNELLMGKDIRCFNNSIVYYQGRIFMMYRFEPYQTAETELAMVELDPTFMPFGSSRKLRIPRMSSKICTMDDPRAFVFKNEMWFTHCQGALSAGWEWSSTLCLSKADANAACNTCFQPEYGNNFNYATHNKPKGNEKNWSPFIHEGKLHMIYMMDPLTIIEYDTTTLKVKEVPVLRDAIPYSWDMGKPYGGTPLIKRDNGYFGIFHSYTVSNPSLSNGRTYHIGAFSLKKSEDGFYIDKMSTKPLMSAVEDSEKDLRHQRAGWRPNCVYPCGLFEMNSRVYMSYGWQDCRCYVAEMTWDEIDKDMETIDYSKTKKRITHESNIVAPIGKSENTEYKLTAEQLAERSARFKNQGSHTVSK